MDKVAFRSLLFECICEVNNRFFFFPNIGNMIYSMDEDCNEIECAGVNIYEESYYKYLYTAMLPYNGKIYLIPRAAKYISIYDISKQVFEKIEIKDFQETYPITYDPALKFSNAVILNEKMILIPRKYPAIIVIDLKSNKLTYHQEWLNRYADSILFNGEYFLYDFAVDGDEVYIPALSAHEFIVIDALRDTIHTYNTKANSYFSGAEIIDNKLYLSRANSGDLEVWDIKKKEFIEVIPVPTGSNTGAISFGWLQKVDDVMVLIPFWHDELLMIDVKGSLIKKYHVERNNRENQIAFCCKQISGDRLFLLDNINMCILVFDKQFNLVDKKIPNVTMSNLRHIIRLKNKANGYVEEDGLVSLESFIDTI